MGERIEKVKEILKKDKRLLFLLISALLGIVFLLFSELIDFDNKKTEEELPVTTYEYADMIENKLSELISSIDGAGEAVVMVTVETGEENVFAKEVKSDEDTNENKASSSFEYEYVVIKSGSSSENGMLLKVIEPEIRGVAIVCDGGENAKVRENIVNTVSAVLDIKTNKISVCKKNG